VCATAEVVDVEGKRVDFNVSASDGIKEAGTHQRIVIDLRSFNERLAKKRATNATADLILRPALDTRRAPRGDQCQGGVNSNATTVFA
jgi:hypothetical protein